MPDFDHEEFVCEWLTHDVELQNLELELSEECEDDVAALATNLEALLASAPSQAQLQTAVAPPIDEEPQHSEQVLTKKPQARSYGRNIPMQTRLFVDRSSLHRNFPQIPRWQDRARLRRIQTQAAALLPDDLPPWSVRTEVPTIPQPDNSEGDKYLLYDGFNIGLVTAYQNAVEFKQVPRLSIPYRDDEMERCLVEHGKLTQEQVEGMRPTAAPDSWRGPMERQDDEKYRAEIDLLKKEGLYTHSTFQ